MSTYSYLIKQVGNVEKVLDLHKIGQRGTAAAIIMLAVELSEIKETLREIKVEMVVNRKNLTGKE